MLPRSNTAVVLTSRLISVCLSEPALHACLYSALEHSGIMRVLFNCSASHRASSVTSQAVGQAAKCCKDEPRRYSDGIASRDVRWRTSCRPKRHVAKRSVALCAIVERPPDWQALPAVMTELPVVQRLRGCRQCVGQLG